MALANWRDELTASSSRAANFRHFFRIPVDGRAARMWRMLSVGYWRTTKDILRERNVY
jgi:hypothetical protein